jgi:hypothetical protein
MRRRVGAMIAALALSGCPANSVELPVPSSGGPESGSGTGDSTSSGTGFAEADEVDPFSRP